MANIVGAKPDEIALMNGLTVNIHLLFVSFYNPTEKRKKILMEKKAFPSDIYAVKSHMETRGIDHRDALVEIAPRENELIQIYFL